MGTSCVALSIKNIKTRASREMTSRKKWGGGGRCQALECGRARYLPSLIALFVLLRAVLNLILHHLCNSCNIIFIPRGDSFTCVFYFYFISFVYQCYCNPPHGSPRGYK